jgi:[ribosomal protein S5]-alanine N-acetyltransferase
MLGKFEVCPAHLGPKFDGDREMAQIPSLSIKTNRLVLRPTVDADAQRAFEIQSDWEVTRMLLMASFPPDRNEMQRWFAAHGREWRRGEAFRFAVMLRGEMIGVVDIEDIVDREGTLGYWFDRVIWGRGYAFEASEAVTPGCLGRVLPSASITLLLE